VSTFHNDNQPADDRVRLSHTAMSKYAPAEYKRALALAVSLIADGEYNQTDWFELDSLHGRVKITLEKEIMAEVGATMVWGEDEPIYSRAMVYRN